MVQNTARALKAELYNVLKERKWDMQHKYKKALLWKPLQKSSQALVLCKLKTTCLFSFCFLMCSLEMYLNVYYRLSQTHSFNFSMSVLCKWSLSKPANVWRDLAQGFLTQEFPFTFNVSSSHYCFLFDSFFFSFFFLYTSFRMSNMCPV